SWDGPVQREYGARVYNYLTEHDPDLLTDRHRYYGPVVEVGLFWLEQLLSLKDSRTVFLMRHLVTFIIFWIGSIFFYLVAKRIVGKRFAILAPGLLVVSPRIFAHSFYNTKDIPFMIIFIVGVYTLLRLLETRTPMVAILHGFTCALLIDIRIIGILLAVMTVVVLVFDFAGNVRKIHFCTRGLVLAGFLGSLTAFTILMWPTLWQDPLKNFVRSFEVMRSFPWEAPVLYLGSEVWSTNLPWHYLPVWMGVSSPVAVILLGAAGFVVLVARAFRRDPAVIQWRHVLIVLLWCWLPMGYLMFSDVVLYDAWRHAFFIYPSIVLAAVWTLSELSRFLASKASCAKRVVLGIVLVGFAVDLVSVTIFMVRNHPHENVYFNTLVGGVRGAVGKFELDYWGLCYRQGLEWIAATDSHSPILVNAATAPGRYNAYMLKSEDRRRLLFVPDPTHAEYYVTNFRWQRGKPPGREVYSIRVDGARILSIFRL
ncbi:MAG TPA: hypothetical protein ENI46_00365, partial [Firmicutes bacterium]|nr:hypothetical protein [Bacillota bacterium]